jgi:ribulose-phosphate 3-epimerase
MNWEEEGREMETDTVKLALGKRAGLVINPATPAAVLEEIVEDIEQVLIMTFDPGFGHQHFIPTTPKKIRRVRQMIEQIKPGCDVEVDGGIDMETASLAVAAGANVLAAGTAVFDEHEGVTAAMNRLRASINQRGGQGPRSLILQAVPC